MKRIVLITVLSFLMACSTVLISAADWDNITVPATIPATEPPATPFVTAPPKWETTSAGSGTTAVPTTQWSPPGGSLETLERTSPATTQTEPPLITPEPGVDTEPAVTAARTSTLETAESSETTPETTGCNCEEDESCDICAPVGTGGGGGALFAVVAVLTAGMAAAAPFVIKEIKLNKIYKY